MAEDNIVVLNVETTLPLPSERVLRGAIENEVEDVIVLGYAKDGAFYFASAPTDKRVMLWLVEHFKNALLQD